MALGNLCECRTRSHVWPAVGEVDLEAGPSQWCQRPQGEGSFEALPRISVIQGKAAQVDQRLTRTHNEIRQPAGEGSLSHLDCGHGLILLSAPADARRRHFGRCGWPVRICVGGMNDRSLVSAS